MEGQNQRGAVGGQLMTFIGVHDPEIALLPCLRPSGHQKLHGALQQQAHLQLLVEMGGAVEQVDEKNLVISASVGDHLKFVSHGATHLYTKYTKQTEQPQEKKLICHSPNENLSGKKPDRTGIVEP